MSKLLSVCAFAGDKVSAATAATIEVGTSVSRALLHGDRSYLIDTVRECTGTKRTMVAVRETLDYLSTQCAALRTSGRYVVPAVGAPAWQVEFLLSALPDNAQVSVLTVQSAKSDAVKDSVGAWATGVAIAWMQAVNAHIDAAAAVAKDKRAANAAAKPVIIVAPVETSDVATLDGAVNIDAVIDAATADMAQRLTVSQANTEKARDMLRLATEHGLQAETRADAAEARCADLLQIIATMEQRETAALIAAQGRKGRKVALITA